MKKATYHLLDVFTNKKFGGNQLAIFENASEIPSEIFQNIAQELNLSETVFLFPKNSDGLYPMRIFTPIKELPTAGHPSIGTAYFIAQNFQKKDEKITIKLGQNIGPIEVKIKMSEKGPLMATMYQVPPYFGKILDNRTEIAQLLNLKTSDLMDYPIQEISCGVPYIIVPVRTIENIQNLTFNTQVWEKLQSILKDHSIYAFTPHGLLPDSDLHGRMFAPEIGITEDPATGSANGPLACYLFKYDIKKGPLISEQGFEMNRPSILHIEIESEKEIITNVKVGGQAVFVGQGQFSID
ncbi:MAG: phenazine biosynthesis protein PhzF [Flammeovirgaceae bacterium]|nr:phenazine biosynthesis protein PhzF [Flammeovirgaceae bacterium]|tara:strand:- start:1779 stop:2666 length:888 start_codon:yes stop_codon:yes gene_type:complete